MTKAQQEYAEYLKSDHWKALRDAALKLANYGCRRCGSCRHLEVHHTVYRSRWEETDLLDLEVLCRSCHELHHHPEARFKPKKPSRSRRRWTGRAKSKRMVRESRRRRYEWSH